MIDTAHVAGSAGRGALLLGFTGGTLLGLSSTLDVPFAGTFFGALYGLAFGAVIGAVDGLVLGVVGHRTPPVVVLRLVSLGVVLVGVAVMAALPLPVWDLPVAVKSLLVAAAMLVAVAVGPLVALGSAAVAHGGRLERLAIRCMSWCGGLGLGGGALAGGVLGLLAYPPTAGFAVVEGGILGLVSGLVLAGVVVGIVAVPVLLRPPAR